MSKAKTHYWLLVRRKGMGTRRLERVVLDGKPVTWDTERDVMAAAKDLLATRRDVAAVHVRRSDGYERIGTPD